jgi:hypothetical protein
MCNCSAARSKRPFLRRRTIAWLLACVVGLAMPLHSIAKPAGMPTGASHVVAQRQVVNGPLASPTAANTPLTPFLDIVPDSNGHDVFISAGGVGQLGGTVFANLAVGPSGNKGSYTMTYSNTGQAYFTTAIGFAPAGTEEAELSITTTLGLNTGITNLRRAYVPARSTKEIRSVDGNLQVSVVTTDTLTSETYIAVVPSFAPPGPAPAGHLFIGSVYSARASGALAKAGKPMVLHLTYDPASLADADPRTLAIFAWVADPNNKHWERLGGQLFADQGYVSVATKRFTTYALMATTTWHDDFEDFELGGLDQARSSNITPDLLGENLAVALQDTPGQGVAVSLPITPTTVISGWGTLIFTATAPAPSTTLAVDVLSADGTTVLLSNIASGASLASIDAVQHPAIRLRARLDSTAVGQSPKLDAWQVTWQHQGQEQQFSVYLPAIVR